MDADHEALPMNRRVMLGVVALVLMVGSGWWTAERYWPRAAEDRIYGNVEIRQVDLAFNAEGRVETMAREEGDAVAAGQVIAQLDDASYRSAVDLTTARRDAAQAALDKLLHGTRIEDIDQARANLAAAQATLANAQVSFQRQATLVKTSASPRQAYDDAKRALDTATASVAQTQAALDEAIKGPRIEDIDAARANLKQSEASLDLARIELARTQLQAPAAGIVMTRVIEPGTVVLPGSIVYSIALTSEVWVRAFVPEPMLGRVAPGTDVTILTDGTPPGRYRGRIGYVSPQAEFTPKTVETPELRSQLVYRLRIRVTDPNAGIRQGQPVTIVLPQAGG